MSAPATFVQIVPRITAPPSGVVDYGLRVAEGLRDTFGMKTILLAGAPATTLEQNQIGWPSHSLTVKSARCLQETLDAIHARSPFQCMLVHVSGYGYAPRGAPFWLAQGLSQWLAKRSDIKVIGVFHELFATGRPWQSSFWFGALQAYVTRRIWRLCDAAITTNTLYMEQLRAWRVADCPPIELLPVVSTVGEPEAIAPFDKRARTAIVFASPGVEKTLYANCGAALEQAVNSLGIERIIDIGGRRQAPPSSVSGAPVTALGRLPAAQISALMCDASYGFLYYDASRMGKSTVFAAYAAHGLVPVCFGSGSIVRDGLDEGRELLVSPSKAVSDEDGRRIQTSVKAWYQAHSIARLVDRVALLSGVIVQAPSDGQSTAPASGGESRE